MAYSIGKIRKYNNYTGEIISKDGIYLFTANDISNKDSFKDGDVVIFRAEEVQNVKKAFFVKKVTINKGQEASVTKKTIS